MAKGQCVSRRAAKVGVFVAGLMLVLGLPAIAFAANTATFSSAAPKPGSSTTASKPTISVIVNDRYGVSGSSNFSMTLDGKKVAVRLSRYSGFGLRKFKLSFAVPSGLSIAKHTVVVKVRDLRRRSSTYTWSFTVRDGVPPVTTSDLVLNYTGLATIHLTASDNMAIPPVTYYILDGGARTTYAGVILVAAVDAFHPFHTIEFWSVDASGNTEAHHFATFMVAKSFAMNHSLPASLPDASFNCVLSGCHGMDHRTATPKATTLADIHAYQQQPGGTILPPGCAACHGASAVPSSNCAAAVCHGPAGPHATNHRVVASVPTTPGAPSCTQDVCHGSGGVVALHTRLGGCVVCHAPTANSLVPPTVTQAVVAAGGATCEDCHYNTLTPSFADIHRIGATVHTVNGACFSANCHFYTDVSLIHTKGDNPPGCFTCHALDGSKVPTLNCQATGCHLDIVTVHSFVHVDASGTKSSACTQCHGTDIPTVHANLGCFCHTNSLGFSVAGEMAPLLAAGKGECVDCHKDQFAPHGFANSSAAPAASGHNTTTFGSIGAKSLWDGSQGVVVKDSTGATITQEWPLPTANVFWSQVDHTKSSPTTDAAPATANTTVGWGSVITCQDCHTGLNTSMGPQGANVGQVGLDPNYPDDWTRAEITSVDPTGMRSVDTTMGSPNPYYDKAATYVTDGTLPTVSSYDFAIGARTATASAGSNMILVGKGAEFSNIGTSSPDANVTFYAKYDPSDPNMVAMARTVAAAGAFSGGVVTRATVKGGLSNGYSPGDIPGKFICQKCHKLVNPYQGIPGADGNGRGGRNNNLNYIGFSNEIHMEHHGNLITGVADCVACHIAVPHGWKRPRLLVYETDAAPYKVDLPAVPAGVTSAFNQASGSTHLDAINAAPSALKDLSAGGAVDFAPNDAANGTNYSFWSSANLGTGWLADPNALPSADAVQNNCNACSKTGTTHVPVAGGEGFTSATPSWK